MPAARIVTVNHPHLSLWQSAAARAAREAAPAKAGPLQTHQVLADPLVTAAAAHVRVATQLQAETGTRLRGAPGAPTSISEPARISMLHHRIAEAELAGDDALAEQLRKECRSVATCHTAAWINCEKVYLEYRRKYKNLKYRDWKSTGRGKLSYGVIPYQLPADAKVAIIADWGTATDDAAALLEETLDRGADVVIHLGDIYFSGTPEECEAVYKQIQAVFEKKKRSVPVFMTPGNHDYYALGYGFYPMLDKLNSMLPDAAQYKQPASYFCLRSADGKWQFLAMDTGQDDYAPSNAFNPRVAGPKLRANELRWHRDKLDGWKGRTILLSHHQLFTAHDKINGALSGQSPVYVNNALLEAFAPYFGEQVWAWFWGHEHNLVFYQDGYKNLAKGRLVGCGGYEEAEDESPYEQKYPVPYLPPVDAKGEPKKRLGVLDDYYNHGYAIIDLATEEVTYYQIASWGGNKRKKLPEKDRIVMTEQLTGPRMNMLNHVPLGMKAGHSGRWDGSPNGKPLTWFNLNKISGSPTVKTLSASELRITGPYKYLGTPSWKNPTGVRKGTIEIRIWDVGTNGRCKFRSKVTGSLAEEYLGKNPFDTGTVSLRYSENLDDSVVYKAKGASVKQKPFAKDAIWYPGIEFDVAAGGKKLFLAFEDMKL